MNSTMYSSDICSCVGGAPVPSRVTDAAHATFSRVESIASNAGAFAALHADGTVSVWGKQGYGGRSGHTVSGAPARVTDATAATFSRVVSVVSASIGLAALHADGTVSAWGAWVDDGVPSRVTDPAPGALVVGLAGSNGALTALVMLQPQCVPGSSYYAPGAPHHHPSPPPATWHTYTDPRVADVTPCAAARVADVTQVAPPT